MQPGLVVGWSAEVIAWSSERCAIYGAMPMDFGEAAAAVAALADELRGPIYAFVRAQARPVSRDEVAAHMGISRGLAAFHLDKLIDAGWLTASYARPPGRSGRGAGRTSKYYQPSDVRLELSVPARRYDVVGRILIAALQAAAEGESPQDAAHSVGGRREARRRDAQGEALAPSRG